MLAQSNTRIARAGLMRCMTCGGEMTAAYHHGTNPEVLRHRSLQCLSCGSTERTLVFRQGATEIAVLPPDSSRAPQPPPAPGSTRSRSSTAIRLTCVREPTTRRRRTGTPDSTRRGSSSLPLGAGRRPAARRHPAEPARFPADPVRRNECRCADRHLPAAAASPRSRPTSRLPRPFNGSIGSGKAWPRAATAWTCRPRCLRHCRSPCRGR